jgi:hypothetical protein
MTRDKGNENQLKVKDQEALSDGVALVNIGGVLEEISESQEVASEGHHEPLVFYGNAELPEGLANRGESQAVGVDDRLGKLMCKLPPQDLLADSLEIEEKETRR